MTGLVASLSNVLVAGLVFLVVLTIIIVAHELGHFLVARWCGVKVKAFSVGFGPELFHYTDRQGTRWRVAAYPIGGYVRLIDDADEASTPSTDVLKTLSPEERAGAFQLKPLWQRAAVIAAGPFANFVLATFIFGGLTYALGIQTMPAIIDEILPNTPAFEAGLKQGDRIAAIDGTKIQSFDEAYRIISASPGRELTVDIERDHKPLQISLTPQMHTERDPVIGTYHRGLIGIRPFIAPYVGVVDPKGAGAAGGLKREDRIVRIDGAKIGSFNDVIRMVSAAPGRPLDVDVERDGLVARLKVTPAARTEKDPVTGAERSVGTLGILDSREHTVSTRYVDPVTALGHGAQEMWGLIRQNLQSFHDLFAGRQSTDDIGGPVRMAQLAGAMARVGLDAVLHYIAFLSIGVGVFNLIPILPLDGGHLLFFAIEGVLRRPVGESLQRAVMGFGLVLILSLTALVMWNDIFGRG